jgi:PleD family two-component response regulator
MSIGVRIPEPNDPAARGSGKIVERLMSAEEKVNILMVDDQPGKLLSYEAILADLGENLIKATSAKDALEKLLKTDVAAVLMTSACRISTDSNWLRLSGNILAFRKQPSSLYRRCI